MKKNIYRHLLSYLTIILLLSSSPVYTADASNNVKIKPIDVGMNFDGSELRPPAGQFVFIHKGTTYVPLRFVSYAVQKNVNWNGKESKVTITDPTPAQLISIKEKLMNTNAEIKSPSADYKLLTPVLVKYEFNGQNKNLPNGQASYMYKGTLYVPIRFISESAGISIKWDQESKTVSGSSAASSKSPDVTQDQGNKGTDTTTGPVQPAVPVPGTPALGGTPAQGGSGPSAPIPGGSGASTVTYETITRTAESKLQSLQSESRSILFSLAQRYLSASDESTKQQLLAQGQQQLDQLTAQFETIVSAAESELKAGGHSTAIINEYRKTFQDEIEAGKQLAEGLAG
ncbi:stalk domain-containing protein [Paenibacillus sp. JSM ZJ436]|uniref:stalk domain-containing protein n=1 Tax=Paenibacillus sp. JSM ZJ436 TaxID=3376190 RepID=UPI0037BB47DE